ncbi:TIR domain-containing protein [Polymorphospora lycopeni]|uniref:TIR domain-containing protein n=1 Tax=Polymorphospora lycopeni TaxID=3140240 RepID=A0ABV5CSY8_9ACTN
MSGPRAFISFEMEDRWARDFLVEHAKNKNNSIQFVDYSVHDPFDSKWKTNCKIRIAQTAGTIVLIGPTTYLSEAVLWEIAETTRQGNHMFGIQIHRDRNYRIPTGLLPRQVIRWNFDSIVAELESWT